MSAVACEIIGTGDGKLKNPNKTECSVSKTIAKDLVQEIIENVLEIVDDSCDGKMMNIMKQIPAKEYKKEQCILAQKEKKEKITSSLIGTGDQKSDEILKTQEPIPYHPPVEKKNRLTDLVKNSKQILAKIMMSDSKLVLQEENKKEEEVVDVIELDCVHMSDIDYNSASKVSPEDIPLPDNDSEDLSSSAKEESLDEIKLTTTEEPKSVQKKVMTFPRASGSKAKQAFAAKCRTLKMGASNLKKKKWDVSRIVNFFKKKRGAKDEKKLAQISENAKQDDGEMSQK